MQVFIHLLYFVSYEDQTAKDLLPAIILGCYFVFIVLLKVLNRKKQCELIFLGC